MPSRHLGKRRQHTAERKERPILHVRVNRAMMHAGARAWRFSRHHSREMFHRAGRHAADECHNDGITFSASSSLLYYTPTIKRGRDSLAEAAERSALALDTPAYLGATSLAPKWHAHAYHRAPRHHSVTGRPTSRQQYATPRSLAS